MCARGGTQCSRRAAGRVRTLRSLRLRRQRKAVLDAVSEPSELNEVLVHPPSVQGLPEHLFGRQDGCGHGSRWLLWRFAV